VKNGLLLKEINSLYLKDHFFRVNVIARRKRGADDAAIHCMQWARTDNTVRSLGHSGSPRPQGARDDKTVVKDALAMTKCQKR
jgi:hypothetical protein